MDIEGRVMSLRKLFRAQLIIVLLLVVGYFVVSTSKVHAATSVNAVPKISFTFDDGPASNITKAAPALAPYGYTGTAYVTTGCIGKTTTPNNCAADTDVSYMSWAQVKSLRDTYGWEIGAHSVSHPEMTTINATKLESEAANSKAALVAQGFNPTAFATPYGDYNDKVLSAVAKYYTSHRGFADTGYNTYPYNNYLLRVQQVQVGVSVETVKGYIDQAIASNTWLILVFHEIRDIPSTNVDDYQYATTDLAAIAAYAKLKGIGNTNVTSGLVAMPSNANLVSEPITASNTVGNGWTTDVSANVAVNTQTKGNIPEPTKSVAITSNTTKNVHLFSPNVAVNSVNEYVVKGYVNMASNQAAEMGCYVDEYDITGRWISGQYVQTLAGWYTRDISFVYIPSSVNVAQARLQLIMALGTKKIAYVDSIQWFVTKTGTVIVVPPDPEQPNLIQNGSFVDALTNWSTDTPSIITHDTANNGGGASTVDSVKLSNYTTKNAHLFSSKIAVSSTKQYTIKAYANIVTIGQGIGFYIDEYDVNGNWISGKYLYTKQDEIDGYITFSYTPTSSTVNQASLQVILPSGTGTLAYLDDISWTQA